MSYQFANVNGNALHLLSAGQIVGIVPAGYSGPLDFQGPVTVAVAATPQVVATTNIAAWSDAPPHASQISLLNSSGHDVLVDWAVSGNYQSLANGAQHSFTDTAGISLYVLNYDQSLAVWGAANIPYVAQVSGVLTSNAAGFSIAWTIPPGVGGTTNYGTATNPVTGATLGDYVGGGGVRQVIAGVAGVEVQTYAGHVEAFGWGLALGVVVFGYRWVCNVIGSIGREQDL